LTAESPDLPLAFDLWEITAPPAGGELSFGLPGSGDEEIALWEIDLPAETGAASEFLQRQGEWIQASLAALDSAPGEIQDFVRNVGGRPLSEVSFDATPAQPLSEAEQQALRELTYLELGPDDVSFSTAETSRTELDQASQQFQDAVDRMLRLARYFAWVETKIGGKISGRTVVNWSGDMQNVWVEEAETDIYTLHQQSVEQALASRNILVHACVTTTQSAAKLAVLLTNPAGAILALPVAWKLVNQILKDVERYRDLTHQEMNHA